MISKELNDKILNSYELDDTLILEINKEDINFFITEALSVEILDSFRLAVKVINWNKFNPVKHEKNLAERLAQAITEVKKANLQFIHTNNPCFYFKESVLEWLEDQASGDPVKLLNFFNYCLEKQAIEVY